MINKQSVYNFWIQLYVCTVKCIQHSIVCSVFVSLLESYWTISVFDVRQKGAHDYTCYRNGDKYKIVLCAIIIT